MPVGVHTAVITNGEGHKLQIRAIHVDGLQIRMTTTKNDYYSYFVSFLMGTTSFGQIRKRGRITHPNSQINGGLVYITFCRWRRNSADNEVSLLSSNPAQIRGT
jgi:hypothetical protein